MSTVRVAVVVGPGAPELERFAAAELCHYLERCFGVRASPAEKLPDAWHTLFLVGAPSTNPLVPVVGSRRPFPRLSEQGMHLRRLRFRGRPCLLVGGGTPAATLWAVYELAERWGVRFLLHGDALPFRRSLWLPRVNAVIEPLFPIRQWRVVNAHAIGPETWGIEQYRLILGQLAKLKFNRIFVHIWPSQPFLHYAAAGIQRRSAALFWGYRYPITEDMIGRKLFDDRGEFWNPDLPVGASYDELTKAGIALVRSIIDFALSRGMECGINASLFEYPAEFAPALTSARPSGQHLTHTVFPGEATSIGDAKLARLARTVLRALVKTYPRMSFVTLEMPEFRHWSRQYERAWAALDRKYGLERIRPLDKLVAAAGRRSGYPGGAARALQEVKGDIVNIYFFDKLLGGRVIAAAGQPEPRVVWDSVCEELFPILPRVSRPGWETLNFIDYAPSSITRRLSAAARLPAGKLPSVLIYTLHDDNVGFMPQLTTGSLHAITVRIRELGWSGFSGRYWLIGNHDPSVAYMARAAWDPNTEPERVARDQVRAACGRRSIAAMLVALAEVENATVLLEQRALGLAFPTPQMMLKHWVPGPLPDHLVQVRDAYRRAAASARKALAKSLPAGRGYARYWVGHLTFGIKYIDAIAAVKKAATAEAAGNGAEALHQTRQALDHLRAGGEAFAAVARDQSDRGAIAVLNQDAYRPLQARAAELVRSHRLAKA